MKFDIKKFAKQYKVSFQKANAYYPEALKTAKEMGLEKDEDYVEETLKDLLDIRESVDIEKLASLYINSNKTTDKFIEDIVSTDIPQKVRPERIVKNSYNFPNDEWNKSKEKRDVWKYVSKQKKENKEPESDSIPFIPKIVVSNF